MKRSGVRENYPLKKEKKSLGKKERVVELFLSNCPSDCSHREAK